MLWSTCWTLSTSCAWTTGINALCIYPKYRISFSHVLYSWGNLPWSDNNLTFPRQIIDIYSGLLEKSQWWSTNSQIEISEELTWGPFSSIFKTSGDVSTKPAKAGGGCVYVWNTHGWGRRKVALQYISGVGMRVGNNNGWIQLPLFPEFQQMALYVEAEMEPSPKHSMISVQKKFIVSISDLKSSISVSLVSCRSTSN